MPYVRLNPCSGRWPASLVQTVEGRLGIPLSAYAEIAFDGLVELVDAVAGSDLSVVATVRDPVGTGLMGRRRVGTSLDGPERGGRPSRVSPADPRRSATRRALDGPIRPRTSDGWPVNGRSSPPWCRDWASRGFARGDRAAAGLSVLATT